LDSAAEHGSDFGCQRHRDRSERSGSPHNYVRLEDRTMTLRKIELVLAPALKR